MAEQKTVSQGIIALINLDHNSTQKLERQSFNGRVCRSFENSVAFFSHWEKEQLDVAAVVAQGDILGPNGIPLHELLDKKKPYIPFFLIIESTVQEHIIKRALAAGVSDIFFLPLQAENVALRANFLIDHASALKAISPHQPQFAKQYKVPFAKRVFDIFFAGLALVCLSPVFLIVILLLKIESRGPAFYYSLRVGTGYKVFRFYKFRSMYVNADKRLKDLAHLNQYDSSNDATAETAESAVAAQLCDECRTQGTKCRFPLYADDISWCEKQYQQSKKAKKGSAFFKLKNDPRITKVGKVLRNTSIDELPQLWNVLIGDMSIVGNRPLPLYEAEKLTTDKYALRFLAPAGITGLWQVEKRGKGEMSEEERLMLDNTYAKNHSFVNDIKLILKTIPALFQKESV